MKTSFKYFALLFVNVMLCVSQAWAVEKTGNWSFGKDSNSDWATTAAGPYCSMYYADKSNDFTMTNSAITNLSNVDFSNVTSPSISITVNGFTNSGTNEINVNLVDNTGAVKVSGTAQTNKLGSGSASTAAKAVIFTLTPVSGVTGYQIVCKTKTCITATSYTLTYTEGAPKPTCVTPTFSPAAGTYDAVQNVTISTTTDGASIYYTTDGSDPTSSSTLYSSAVEVSSSCTLKAIAIKDGCNNSGVASAAYTINIPRDVTYHAPNVAGVTVPVKATGVTSIANLPNPGNPTGCAEDYVFVGWIESATYTGDETIYKAEASYTPTRNADLYAVFGTMTGLSETKYEMISSPTELNDGEKVILWTLGANNQSRIVGNDGGTTVVTDPNGTYTCTTASYLWKVIKSANGYQFQKPDNATYYLTANSTSQSAQVSSKQPASGNVSEWIIEAVADHDGYFSLRPNGGTYKLEFYNNAWSCYNASDWKVNAFHIYHQAADVADLTTSPNCAITVTYDKNGATGGDAPEDSKEYEENEEVTVLGQGTMTHSTKFFRGWDTQAEGNGTRYQEGEHFNITVATTLYAIWDDAQYRRYLTSCTAETEVTFDPNDGNLGSCPSATTIEQGNTDPVCYGLTRTGYTFAGFYTLADGGEQIFAADGTMQTVAGYTESGWSYAGTELTLYAHWTPNNPGAVTISGNYFYFEGETITLTAAAENTLAAEGVTYVWKKGGVVVDGQTSATLTINDCHFSDAGNYTCTISNNGAESTSAAFGVKILKLWIKEAGQSDRGFTFTKLSETTAYVDVELNEGTTFGYCIVDGVGNNYGNSGTMTELNCTGWSMDKNQDCHITTTLTGNYRFTVDFSGMPNYVVSVTYPNPDQAADYPIYFDNSENWSKVVYRIGNGTQTAAAKTLTAVPGTRRLYQTTSSEFNAFLAWHIADNNGWTGSNNVYRTKTNNDEYQISESSEFQKVAVTDAGMTLTMSSTHATGQMDINDNAQFYPTTRHLGLLTHNVSITAPTNGTITVDYTDINGDAQSMTSGNADLAHTCILTISATPAAGYKLTALTVNGVAFTSGNEYDLTADAVIAATFAPITYQVSYNGNSNTGGSMANTNFTYNVANTLRKNGYTKTGYNFIGWALTAGGEVVYNDQESVSNLTTTDGATVELFAKWTGKTINLTWDAATNGGKIEGEDTKVTTYIYDGENAVLPTPDAREGYTFKGWFTSAGGNTQVTEVGTTRKPTTNQTYYAQWTVNKHTLTWVTDGDALTGSYTKGTVAYGTDITAPNTPTKTGYTFAGWSPAVPAKMPDEDVVLTATWTRNHFTVTYHHGDETTCVEEVNEGEKPLMTDIAAKVCSDNRVFVGWVADAPLALTQTAPATVDPTTVTISAAKDFYAVYASRNGGKAGVETLAATEAFENSPTDWVFSANAAYDGTGHVAKLSYLKDDKLTIAYVTSKSKISDLSKIVLDAYITGGVSEHKYAVQYSTNGENWTTIGENKELSKNATWETEQEFVVQGVQDAYVRVVTVPSSFASTYYLWIDNIKTYTKARTFYYTDYSSSCDMAESATMTFAGEATNMAHVASPVGETYILPVGTADGMQFRSWTCSGDGLTYKAGESFVLSHDVTMTAVWDPTLTWYNEQTDANHAVTYAPEDVVVMPTEADPTPCNSILEFVGWGDQIATTKTVEPAMVKAGDAATADKTYYAIFKHKTKAIWVTKCPEWYVVTYHANGGTGDDIVIDSDTRTLTTQAANVFTNTGHQLVAWSTVADLSSSDETATLYKPATSVTIAESPKNVDLYAVWMGEMQISSASPISLTSYNGVEVFTTANPANQITVSNSDMGVAKKLRFRYLNGETLVTGTDRVFRICDGSYSQIDGGINLTTGAFEQLFNLKYIPNASDQKDTYTIRVEATNGNGQFVYASADLVVNGRSLPEKFVVAMKNPNDGLWYALKNVLGTTSAGATPAPELITVDDNTNPTMATLAPASTFYKGATRQTAGEHRGGLRLQGFNNGNLYLTATKTNNATLYTKSGNDDDQQFYLQSSNLSTYNVTLDPTAYNDYSPKRYISMNGGTIGWFATSAKDVYFLPVAAEMTPAELQVVEWKTDAVVVMYTGAATSATTTVGAGAASAVQTLTDAKVDHCVYELTTDNMASAYGKILTVSFNNGGTKLIKMPLIVSGETTASVGTAGNDVVVLKGATFSAESTSRRYPNITVYGGGKLVVGNGTKLEFSNLYLRCGGVVDGNYDYVYPQVVLNGQLNSSLNSQLYIDYVTTKDQYYTFVAPFAISQSAIQYPQDIYGSNVTAENTGSFEFQYYDGAQRATGASGWVTLPDAQGIVPGKGYTFLGMPKKVSQNGAASVRQKFGLHRMHMPVVTADALTHETSNQSIAVSAHDADRDNDANWNLIGNPYMTTVTGLTNSSIKVGKLVQTIEDGKWTGGWHWDDAAPNDQRFLVIPSNDGQSYETVQASSAELPAFKNFFVQIAEGEDLVIPVERRGGRSMMPALYADSQEKEIELPLYMQSGEFEDNLTYLIKSDYTDAFEFNADMYKMLNTKDKRINFYGLNDNSELSFVAVNADIMRASVPVGFSVPAAGEFTIGLTEDVLSDDIQSVLLTDHELDYTTDLTLMPYDFTVEKAETNNTRFTLRVVTKQDTTTDIIGVDGEGSMPRKFIHENLLFIQVDGRTYDATGKLVNSNNTNK